MTELIWNGKYQDGKKMAPVRIPLPFQTIETVNKSAQDLIAAGRNTRTGQFIPVREARKRPSTPAVETIKNGRSKSQILGALTYASILFNKATALNVE